ncbi:Rne/Rng family ribonuclease [Achromobacter xylosoxidans]|uniref:Rne/Rng family ribonuclease n=2 Tax=Alcaligenes xylosoxydans xylosoxydans TaxID=85698 RepID=UPI0003D5FB07|nr:Rne/Rng family ribonuclease [Achromobacter xylosoxidans]AHC45910.1 Ribonuclease E [Achromobacter xylosoxidans NBRC 15126 = ATCC 27061]QKQ56165.1 Rne/Rng family ribonuclease [Achromobacter xylosoxidans]QPR94680.1 Rne/Rng family ribonuclease [Achromobacter xylosoxidans]UON38621.1 Rne/Rng family ribonuclease [Achromobacter xylosoxidans]CKH04121.1 Ribonuclease E [Achromobacter xylosoxidans]
MKRMLFNATHQEELRVAIVDGQKLIDLDIETAGREQRKGNIYKGVITRIEPGLEACFVNYGEDRHGFLPFKEVARSFFKEGVDVRTARIQDALREGQELIVQVEKEERGNKGAALTTFISLAGRYLVLMPNNPRGGGVSRRVEGEDRQELRDTMEQLELPQGMSIIARTAGIGRNVEELQWDLSYLLQLWTAIDGAARDNSAPILIYLESSLVIRAIRDYFSPEIGEILIDTDEIADQATAFMSVVMPDNVQRVKRYRDDIPLFSRFQIEHQIETAYSRTVQLPSGGAIVIDHTEALVSVDVNSARSTRGADIEETALRTNSEAADEVARQLRLRDLGGLIVIDFIDMEDSKNQRAVEQRLRDALHFDRARVQMGKISRFGLMELSRQRLRPALNEGSHITCPRCNGTGVIRDAESSALHVLRLLQEEAMKENTAAVHAQVPVDVATYLLNEKRADITKMEARLKVNLVLIPNKHLETPHHHIERLRHDDPRLEEVKTSFELVEAPATDAPWQPRESEIKARPEALVKGITPSQPAPVSTPAPAPAPAAAPAQSGGGLLKRLFGWLTGNSEPAKTAPAAAQEETGAKRAASPARGKGRGAHDGQERRGERHGSDRNRNRRGESRTEGAEGGEGGRHHIRGNRRPEGERGERQERGERNNRNERGERDQAVQAAQASNRPDVAPEAAGDDAGAGRNRRRGRGRNRREEGQADTPMSEQESMVAALAQSVATALPEAKQPADAQAEPAEAVELAAEGVPATEGAEAGADPERKRRRRRSRRGRRSADEAGVAGSDEQLEDGAEDDAGEQAENLTASAPAAAAPVAAAAPAADVPATPVQAPAQQAEAVQAEAAPAPVQAEQAPAAAIEPQAAQPTQTAAPEATAPVAVDPASQVSEPAAPVATPVQAAVVEPVVEPVVTTAPAAPAEPEAAAAPVVTPAPAAAPAQAAPTSAQPIVVPATAPSAKAQTLHEVVNAAGLQWVETDPERHAQTQLRIAAAHTPVRLGRERKPVAPVSNEPLVQVETRH